MEITPEIEGGWHVEDDFISGVKSKDRIRPHPDFEDGVRYMRVVQAVARFAGAERVGRDQALIGTALPLHPSLAASPKRASRDIDPTGYR
jgi:hypothetical protein